VEIVAYVFNNSKLIFHHVNALNAYPDRNMELVWLENQWRYCRLIE
jgi:hypothetical protein